MKQRGVEQEAYEVPVPHFSTPVKEAYTGVADANVEAATQLNKLVGNVSEKVQQNYIWQEQARMYDARERLANNVADLLTNSNTEKITDTQGNSYEVPSGYLNKSEFSAQGISKDYMTKASALRDEYVDSFKNPQLKAQAARLMDTVVDAGYRQVSAHESSQVKAGVYKSFMNSAMNEVHNATLAATPEDLAQSLSHIRDSYTRYGAFQGMSPDEIQAKATPLYAKAVQNAAFNTLVKTNDIDAANSLVYSAKDAIAPDDVNKITEYLSKQHEGIQREIEHQDNVTKINNEFGMIKDFCEPGAQPPSELDVSHMVASGSVHNDFAASYTAALNAFQKEKNEAKPSDELPYSLALHNNDEQMEAFGKHIKSVMMTEDKQGISNVLQDAMKEAAKNKISQDKLKIIMFYGLQRGNVLDAVMKGYEDVKPSDPALLKLDGGMSSLLDWAVKTGIHDPQMYSDYMDAVKKNIEPKDAADAAKKIAVLRVAPSTVMLGNTPTAPIVLDKSSPSRYFSMKTDKPSEFVHENGMIVPNKKHKQERPAEK